jgi:hypothetical protein
MVLVHTAIKMQSGFYFLPRIDRQGHNIEFFKRMSLVCY